MQTTAQTSDGSAGRDGFMDVLSPRFARECRFKRHSLQAVARERVPRALASMQLRAP